MAKAEKKLESVIVLENKLVRKQKPKEITGKVDNNEVLKMLQDRKAQKPLFNRNDSSEDNHNKTDNSIPPQDGSRASVENQSYGLDDTKMPYKMNS